MKEQALEATGPPRCPKCGRWAERLAAYDPAGRYITEEQLALMKFSAPVRCECGWTGVHPVVR